VTVHGSLFYFAARYGLKVAGVVEPVPGQEPTARHLAEILDLLRGDDPAVLFAEPQLDPALVRALAREAGVSFYTVDPMGGTPDTDSYEGLLRQIVATLDGALE
jgi:zinc transport system substrate-binding protein